MATESAAAPENQQLQRLGALQGRCSALEAAVCSVQEGCRSVAWPQKQQVQRPGALQERPVALEAADAASGSDAGALRGP